MSYFLSFVLICDTHIFSVCYNVYIVNIFAFSSQLSFEKILIRKDNSYLPCLSFFISLCRFKFLSNIIFLAAGLLLINSLSFVCLKSLILHLFFERPFSWIEFSFDFFCSFNIKSIIPLFSALLFIWRDFSFFFPLIWYETFFLLLLFRCTPYHGFP